MTKTPNLTHLAAAKFVESHGQGALGILEERAEFAEELGHKVAARTWHGIAAAAAQMLLVEQPPSTGRGRADADRR